MMGSITEILYNKSGVFMKPESLRLLQCFALPRIMHYIGF